MEETVALSEADYLKQLEDPNVLGPLYGGTLDASQQRLQQLQDLSKFVGGYDPNQNTTDEWTPEVMQQYQDYINKLITGQQSWNQSLTAEKSLSDLPMTQQQQTGSGWGANEYAMDAGAKASGTPSGKYTLAQIQAKASTGLGLPEISKAQAQAYLDAYNNTYNYWTVQNPQQRSTLANNLADARTASVANFVAPKEMSGLYRNRLSSTLGGMRDTAIRDANRDIMRQAWDAKRGASEELNRLGILGGGGRRSASRDITGRAVGAQATAQKNASSAVAGQLAQFDQTAADATAGTANLEADIKNRGYEALSNAATNQQISDFGRSLSTATNDSINQAQTRIAEEMQKQQLYGDLATMVGGGFGKVLSTAAM